MNYFELLGVDDKERMLTAMKLLECTRDDLPFLLGQIDLESQNFKRMRENLSYSSVERIKEIFPRVASKVVQNHVRNPKMLGDLLYGDYKYCGYGGIQLTWATNHAEFFKWDNRPVGDYATTKDGEVRDFWRTAAFYFSLMKPKLASLGVLRTVNKSFHFGRLINRGINSAKDRSPLHTVERLQSTRFWIKACDRVLK